VNYPTDQELLHDYADHNSDTAFTDLVHRHIDLVYSAALRMVRDPHLAQDVTQGVFLALARTAPKLKSRPVLSGWLYRTAQNLAANTVRSDIRRRIHEQGAIAMNDLHTRESEADWGHIEVLLDAALGELSEPERDALLLRYFERKSSREIAQLLKISDEAAQKRVSRAIRRLREFFSKRNVTIGASGLVILISANAVQAAPVGLATVISTSALLTGAAVHGSSLAAVTKALTMTTIQKSLIAGTLAVTIGAGIYEAHQAAHLRAQSRSLNEQIAQLQTNEEILSNRLAEIGYSNNLSADQFKELLKLRGEVALAQAVTTDPVTKEALALKAKMEKLQRLFVEQPQYYVPEMQLLNDKEWMAIVANEDLESANGIQKALGDVRRAAKRKFAPMMQQALKSFMDSNAGQRPGIVSDLQRYFQRPVDDAILDQYKLLSPGTIDPITGRDVSDKYVVTEKQIVDLDQDPWSIGLDASGQDILAGDRAIINGFITTLQPAINAFSAANTGNAPSSLSQIKPFLATPDQQTAFNGYDKLLQNIQINYPWFHDFPATPR